MGKNIKFILFLLVIGGSPVLTRDTSLHLLFGHPGDHLPVGILSLEILTNLSASFLVICSFHSLLLLLLLLLSTHSLIGWIRQDSLICWLLVLCSFVLSSVFLNTFISFASNFCLIFLCFLSCF